MFGGQKPLLDSDFMAPTTVSHYFSSGANTIDDEALKSSPVFQADLLGHSLSFATGRGIFSRGEMDEGSRILLQNLDCSPGGRICDLGCGWGALGAFMAALWPQSRIYSVDINGRAARFAAHNYQINQLKNAAVWCGDGLGAVQRPLFTDVVCNPPIRAGNVVIQSLFDDAHRTLQPGGKLWIVLRTAQGAKSWQKKLAAQFGSCETLEISLGYRVLCSERPAN